MFGLNIIKTNPSPKKCLADQKGGQKSTSLMELIEDKWEKQLTNWEVMKNELIEFYRVGEGPK